MDRSRLHLLLNYASHVCTSSQVFVFSRNNEALQRTSDENHNNRTLERKNIVYNVKIHHVTSQEIIVEKVVLWPIQYRLF